VQARVTLSLLPFLLAIFIFSKKIYAKIYTPRQEVLDYDNIADASCQENSEVFTF
jgi:hypothetical protein